MADNKRKFIVNGNPSFLGLAKNIFGVTYIIKALRNGFSRLFTRETAAGRKAKSRKCYRIPY